MDLDPRAHPASFLENKARAVARLNRYRELLIRKWQLLAAGLVTGLLVGTLLWWLQPPTFISIGRMIVSIKLAIPEGSVYSEELGNFLGTQAALMQSRVVMERAQRALSAPEATLSRQPIALRVNVSPKTSIFVVETSGANAPYVQRFLQAAMEEYIQLKKEMRAQASDTTVAGLSEQALRLEKELRGCQEDLVRFQRSNSVLLLQERGNIAGSYLAALHQRLAAAKAEAALLQSVARTPDGTEVGPFEPVLLPAAMTGSLDPFASEGGEGNAEYRKVRQQLSLLTLEQEDLARNLKPKHPRMVALADEIKRCEKTLAFLRRDWADQLESRKGALARQIGGLEENIEQWNRQALEMTRRAADYEQLRTNEKRLQVLYDRLLGTLQTLDVNKEVSPESVTLLEAASTPFTDVRRPLRQLATSVVVALVVTLGLILLLDHVDDRIHSFTELQEYLSEPVLVQIPRETVVARSRAIPLLGENDQRAAYAEAFRSLRSSLLYLSGNSPRPKTLVLTSSIPNEGKSITSSNLAIALAQSEARVLLVDADLRKGRLDHQFEVSPRCGLYEALTSQCHWDTAVTRTRYANLFFLGRGAPQRFSGDLLMKPAAGEFLKEAAAAYDYVILDTPPVMAADDAPTLASLADGVLFLLRAEHTSAHLACAALERLYRRQARVLGIIFNAVRPSNRDCYGYGHDPHAGGPREGKFTRAGQPLTQAPLGAWNGK